MAIYTNVPTIAVDYLKARRVAFDTPGGGVEGPRNTLGESITIGLTGGPTVVAVYEECHVHEPEEHEYINWIAARCNSSMRFVNVPILTDWSGPFPEVNGKPLPIISGITHSDGSTFSDGSGYSQATVYGEFVEAAALHAGVVRIKVYGAARLLRHSDWFSVYHPDVGATKGKGWRVTRYWEVRDIDDPEAEAPTYTLAIEVPLRQAVTAGQRVEFARPRCVMKFPADFTLPWEAEGWWQSSPTLHFTEAF